MLFRNLFMSSAVLEVVQRGIWTRPEGGGKGWKQNSTKLLSDVFISGCIVPGAFQLSFLSSAPHPGLLPKCSSTDQEMGQLIHRGKSFQRFLFYHPLPCLTSAAGQGQLWDLMVTDQKCVRLQLLHILENT